MTIWYISGLGKCIPLLWVWTYAKKRLVINNSSAYYNFSYATKLSLEVPVCHQGPVFVLTLCVVAVVRDFGCLDAKPAQVLWLRGFSTSTSSLLCLLCLAGALCRCPSLPVGKGPHHHQVVPFLAFCQCGPDPQALLAQWQTRFRGL